MASAQKLIRSFHTVALRTPCVVAPSTTRCQPTGRNPEGVGLEGKLKLTCSVAQTPTWRDRNEERFVIPDKTSIDLGTSLRHKTCNCFTVRRCKQGVMCDEREAEHYTPNYASSLRRKLGCFLPAIAWGEEKAFAYLHQIWTIYIWRQDLVLRSTHPLLLPEIPIEVLYPGIDLSQIELLLSIAKGRWRPGWWVDHHKCNCSPHAT